MCKFLRIDSFSEFRKNEHYSEYISAAEKVYKKYSRYILDDFSSIKNCGIEAFIKNYCPYFWLILNREDKFMGFVYLDNFVGNSEKIFSAEVSTCFDRCAWGIFVRYCAKFFFKMCFDTFGFHKIKAQIYPQNSYVRNFLKDIGFKYESVLISETLRLGKPQDIEVYSLYKNYYYKNNEVIYGK